MYQVMINKLHNNEELEEIISNTIYGESIYGEYKFNNNNYISPELYKKIKEEIIKELLNGSVYYDNYFHCVEIIFHENMMLRIQCKCTLPEYIVDEINEYYQIYFYYNEYEELYDYEFLRYLLNKQVNNIIKENITLVENYENGVKNALDNYLCDDLIIIVLEFIL